MAGDWIKFEIATHEKPEVWAIADALDIDPDAVVGKLLRVWSWFDQHTENGNAPSVTKKLLDRHVCVPGFSDAVIAAGWMLEADGSISLPNFDRHNGKTAKTRATTAKRVAAHKSKERQGNDKGNGKGNAASVSGALPKEEKRREDKEKEPPIVPPGGDDDDSEKPDPFEQVWLEYPKRAGGNSKKSARKAWDARIKSGVSPDDLVAGVRRYAAFCEATGKLNTEFVKQAATFFGPDEHYRLDWSPPSKFPTRKQPATFADLDYDEGVNPDGTFG